MSKYSLWALLLATLASHAAAGPLHNAVKDGDITQVKLLIAQGEDVNERDNALGSPLHQAAIVGDGEMAGLLVAEGADATPITAFSEPHCTWQPSTLINQWRPF